MDAINLKRAEYLAAHYVGDAVFGNFNNGEVFALFRGVEFNGADALAKDPLHILLRSFASIALAKDL